LPTVLREGPYRVFFYSDDRHEPPHVHVERDEGRAKFWLNPVQLHDSARFGRIELGRIQRLVTDRAALLRKAWDDFFTD
jgi:hypothetical protein